MQNQKLMLLFCNLFSSAEGPACLHGDTTVTSYDPAATPLCKYIHTFVI